MVPITGFEDFKTKYESVKDKSSAFVFILFDSRPSQNAIKKFAEYNLIWLDELARAAKIFGFVFLYRDFEAGDKIINPSLEVAALFGIDIGKLPGILVFTDSSKTEGKGSFFPLSPALFSEEPEIIEAAFYDLFDVIKSSLSMSAEPDNFLSNVNEKMADIKRRKIGKPLLKYVKDTFVTVKKFPADLLHSMAEAFAKRAADNILGNPPSA